MVNFGQHTGGAMPAFVSSHPASADTPGFGSRHRLRVITFGVDHHTG
jgi:hypothetical protein